MPPLLLDFYGVSVSLECDNDEVRSATERDFSYFRKAGLSGRASISISAHAQKPPFDALPEARQAMVQPGFVAYECGGERVVDYHGKALSRFDFETESGALWSEDLELLWEKLYLLIHSRVGELLDRRGLHRVHALGLSAAGKGVVCLMPSGGGKTTLGLAALKIDGVRLLSDDTPLITRTGRILPFPLRIGLKEKPADVDERFARRFRRMEHGEKWLIDIEAYGDRIEKNKVEPGAVLVGRRILGKEASIVHAAGYRGAPELFRSAVVGLGLPQLVEYFLRMEMSDIPNKALIAASRAAACAALLAGSKVFLFELCRDSEENRRALQAFLEGPFLR